MNIWDKLNALPEVEKLGVINLAGLAFILVLYYIAVWFSPVGNPTILGWLICKKGIVAVIGVLSMVDALFLIDTSTSGSWWKAIVDDKNMAVAVACAGLFIGLGLVLSGTI